MEAAARIGYPVVLKAEAEGLVHKTDVGGVAAGLESADAVREAYAAMDAALDAHGLALRGVTVQRQVAAVAEVIVGSVRDPQFGPLLMFGSGGVEVEARADVAFALAPVTAGDVDHLLATTWAGRSLAGFRGSDPADREAVVDAIVRLSWLVADHPGLAEVEVNPLLVGAPGEGSVAVDVRGARAEPVS